jgi:hypothetical protein
MGNATREYCFPANAMVRDPVHVDLFLCVRSTGPGEIAGACISLRGAVDDIADSGGVSAPINGCFNSTHDSNLRCFAPSVFSIDSIGKSKCEVFPGTPELPH